VDKIYLVLHRAEEKKMRLGVVGMMPSDFRAINSEHLAAVRALGLSGVDSST
jgi:hypothetical protein